MIEREVILREMGLTPIWHERANNAASAASIIVRDAERQTAIERTTRADAPANDAIVEAQTSPLSSEDRATHIATLGWDQLDADIAECTACKLCNTRTNTVPGVGHRNPDWMVIGEGPGEHEDKQGEPFVGRAGQLLDQMLASVGKSRKENVYIANVVKCRPPGNRDPEAEEIAACAPYLQRQIELAQPKLLLAVGKFAGQTILNADATVGTMRAKPGERNGVPVIVTYHPAYLLRSPLEKAKAWADLVAATRISTPGEK